MRTDELSHVRGWMEPVESLVRATSESDILRTDIHHLEPLPRWGEGPITLLGDSAHAMVTDMGQGAVGEGSADAGPATLRGAQSTSFRGGPRLPGMTSYLFPRR